MEDRQIRELIAELPRERARLGFTAAVLRRLAEPEPQRVVRWPMAWAGATLLIAAVAAGSWGFGEWRQQREEAQARHLLEEIKVEHARLAREVRELQEESRPVLYLGGDESIDFVVDMSRVRPGRTDGDVVPVSQVAETY